MAQYDGSIRINTKITTKEASSQLMTLENRIVKTADKVAALRSKMDSLKNAKIPTQEYSEITAQIQKAELEFNKLLEKQEQMQREGKDNGIAWDRLNQKMDEVGNTIRYAQGELQDLVNAGKAFTLGSGTEQYVNLGQQLQYAENDLSSLNLRHDELIAKQEKASDGYKKLGNTAKKSFEKINKSAKKSGGLLGTIATRFKGLALSLLIFNQISKAFNALTRGIKEGFKNFYEGNERFKNSVDSLKASALTLKNSLASAFSPLVEIAIPYIQRFIEWLTRAVNLIGQFIAALTGKKSYTKAIKMTADDLQEEAKAAEEAEEATKGYLSPLDKINKYKESKTDKDKEKDKLDPSSMFEEVPIDNKILDFIQKIKDLLKPVIDYAQKLKDIFMQGFFDGLGDWEYRWQSIKDSIASIKDSLIDIFTDPAVLASANGWAQSVAYMLGSLAGSMTSIGLTIATNLLGGISKYLEQNKERIKKYLVSMFNIWEEVNYMFADLFQSIAYVFEAFASEDGQRLTANLIGIFVDAFMGVTELASKLIKDILNIFIQPFVDNKEEFRTALEGFLGVLADVAGTIKDAIDDTFDKLNEVYDTHFKPFFDSIANGLSDLVKRFLDFWNGKVQPVLSQMVKEFDELWKTHIQPAINNFIEILGKVADLLKALWENILQPFIAWVIDNILPKILPVIKAIWDTLVDFVAYISDAINAIITIIGGIIDFLTGVFSGDWNLAFQGLTDVVQGFVDGIKIIVSGIVEIGKDIILGLMEGISAVASGIFQFIKDFIVDPFVNAFKSLFGIHSPSTVMAELGKYIIEGLLNGIKSLIPNVQEIWEGMKEAAINIWNDVKESLANTWENIKQTAVDTWENIKQNLSEKWENLKTGAKNTFNNIKENIKGSWANIKENVKESAENVKTNIVNAWTRVKENTSTAWGNIKQRAVSSAQSMAASIREKFGTLQGVFRGFSSSAQSIWGSAWEGMKSKVGSVLSSIQGTISSVFSWISRTISSLGNSLRNLVSSVFSGGSTRTTITGHTSGRYSRTTMPTSMYSSSAYAFLSTAPIPALARGAVIPANKEFLAVLGDQKHGTNIEAPLDTIKQASAEAVMEVLSKLGVTGNIGSNNPQTIIIKQYLDSKQVAESVIKEGKVQQMATGNNMFLLGTT